MELLNILIIKFCLLDLTNNLNGKVAELNIGDE